MPTIAKKLTILSKAYLVTYIGSRNVYKFSLIYISVNSYFIPHCFENIMASRLHSIIAGILGIMGWYLQIKDKIPKKENVDFFHKE